MDKVTKLIDLLAVMRDPQQGCAWTKDQSWESLAPQTLEETYELIEAIEGLEPLHLKQELGDMLYHVIFYCQLAKENQWFDINEVAQQMLTKLELRMPDPALRAQFNAEQINAYWQQQKLQNDHGVLSNISKTLPAMLTAQKLQEKASTVGFDWHDAGKVLAKISEEIAELQHEITTAGGKQKITAEFGDLLFSCINLGRHLGVSAEMALRTTNSKFKRRFAYIEQHAAANGKSLTELSLAEMEALWQQAKGLE